MIPGCFPRCWKVIIFGLVSATGGMRETERPAHTHWKSLILDEHTQTKGRRQMWAVLRDSGGCSCDRGALGLSFTYSQDTWMCKTVDTNSSPPSPGQVVQPRAHTFQSVGIIRLPSENEFLTMAITTSNRGRFTSQREDCPVLQVGSLPPKPNVLWVLWPCNSMWRNLFWGNNTTVYSDISIKTFSLALFVIGKKNKLHQCLRFFSVWW